MFLMSLMSIVSQKWWTVRNNVPLVGIPSNTDFPAWLVNHSYVLSPSFSHKQRKVCWLNQTPGPKPWFKPLRSQFMGRKPTPVWPGVSCLTGQQTGALPKTSDVEAEFSIMCHSPSKEERKLCSCLSQTNRFAVTSECGCQPESGVHSFKFLSFPDVETR